MIWFLPCVSILLPYIDNWIHFLFRIFASTLITTLCSSTSNKHTCACWRQHNWHTRPDTQFTQHRPSWYTGSQNSDTEYRQSAQMHWPNAIPTELCPAHRAMQSQWWHFEDCFHWCLSMSAQALYRGTRKMLVWRGHQASSSVSAYSW